MICSVLTSTGVLCNRPMGMQSGSIKNKQITASSYINQNKDQYHAPWLGRLQRHRKGRYAGAWVAKYNTPYQWLQVDFGKPSKIIKISTQGRHDSPMWVRQYYVTRSLDAIHFKQYEERNSLKVCRREIINRPFLASILSFLSSRSN